MKAVYTVPCHNHHARVYRSPKPGAKVCVYIFGALQDISTLDLLSDVMSDYYDYIAVELPGYGLTDSLEPKHTFEYLADCLNEVLLSEIRFTPVTLIASSYGASVAVEWLRKYPQQAASCVLAGPIISLDPSDYPKLLDIMKNAYTNKAQFASSFIDMMMSSEINPKRFNGIKNAAIRRAKRNSERHLINFVYNTFRISTYHVPTLKDIQVPVLVTTGEHDPFCRPAAALELSRQFSAGEFRSLDGCDHLFHIEDPEGLIRTVSEFLKVNSEIHPAENVKSR